MVEEWLIMGKVNERIAEILLFFSSPDTTFGLW